MIGHGYTRNTHDNYVYHHKLQNGSPFIYYSYVDDMLIAAKDIIEIKKLKA